MNLTKNALVDAFDALSACEDADSTWLTAVDISKSFGIDAINVGAIDIADESLIWGRSSMKASWLETYVAREYEKNDALIELFSSKKSRKTIYCDPVSIAAGTDGGTPDISAALNDAGYSLLHGTKFTTRGDPVGHIVTLCFHEMERDDFDNAISVWTTIAALIGSFSMAANERDGANVFVFNKPKLTAREIEVLNLLASGLQTARIAETLDLAEITVSKHLRTARDKLGSSTREQALIKAMQYDMLTL